MKASNQVRFDDAEWLRRMAELEDRCESVTVGGLAVDAGLYRAPAEPVTECIARDALAKLVEFTRRDLGLSAMKFAERADIDLVDLVRLEHAESFVLEPQKLAQLARLLDVPVPILKSLAGITRDLEPNLRRAVLRFAANAEPQQALSKEEQEALREFVKDLSTHRPCE